MPLPLQGQNPTDGGQLLLVKGANPAFGVKRALKQTDPFIYAIDIETDSSTLAGRLFLQVNETCCELDPDLDPGVTRFLQSATEITPGPMPNQVRMAFGTVVPCVQVPSGTFAYVVPVLATGGFADGPMGTRPEGLGTVDKTHYWSVRCP